MQPSQELILVAGARGQYERGRLLVALNGAQREFGVTIQAFSPAGVYGKEHLAAAAAKAVRAHREKRGIAKDLATEIACYAAGDPQISKALKLVGLPSTGMTIVLVAIGDGAEEGVETALESAGMQRADSVVQRLVGTLDLLGITPAMRAMVPEERWGELVLERVALLDAVK